MDESISEGGLVALSLYMGLVTVARPAIEEAFNAITCADAMVLIRKLR